MQTVNMLKFRLFIFFSELLLFILQRPIIWREDSDFKIINSQRENLKSVYKVRKFGVVHCSWFLNAYYSFTRLEDAKQDSIQHF